MDSRVEVQGARYWHLGIGRDVGYARLGQYVASLPDVPETLRNDDGWFPLLVLVEPRVNLKRLCQRGNVDFVGNDETFEAYDLRNIEFERPTWIRMQDGRKNRGRSPHDCRMRTFARDEIGLTGREGVCSYLQYPEVVSDVELKGRHIMGLSGSVRRGRRGYGAGLRSANGRVGLGWSRVGISDPAFGPASRRVL